MEGNTRTARIDGWMVQAATDGPGFFLKGNVSEHERNPEPGADGLHTTSQLKSIDFERGLAVSQNTQYTLGEQAPPAA